MHLIAGLEPEYYEVLGGPVVEKKIIDFKDFVTRGIEFYKKNVRRGHTFITSSNDRSDVSHLMGDYYSNLNHNNKKVTFAVPPNQNQNYQQNNANSNRNYNFDNILSNKL